MSDLETVDTALISAATAVHRREGFSCKTSEIARLTQCIRGVIKLKQNKNVRGSHRVRSSTLELYNHINKVNNRVRGEINYKLANLITLEIDNLVTIPGVRYVSYHLLRLLAAIIADRADDILKSADADNILQECGNLASIFYKEATFVTLSLSELTFPEPG